MSKRLLRSLIALVLVGAMAWYLNLQPAGDQVKGPAPASGEVAGSGDPSLPCHVYKEHRKDVDPVTEIPVLKDQKAASYKVLDVTDGDTIVVAKNGETRVRLMAMDTPEKSDTRFGTPEFYGEEAWKHAKKLIEASGNEVRLTYDKTKQDQYGRDLAYVWLKDGRMLNAVMVADGYAYSYTSSPKPQYVDAFLSLMRQARTQGKGLWGHCQ